MSSYTKRKIAFRTCALVMALLAVLTITLNTLDKARENDIVLFFSMDENVTPEVDANTAATSLDYNVRTLADKIHDKIGADVIRLKPTIHYVPVKSDLKDQLVYTDRLDEARHYLNEDLDLSKYKRVFIGFPVWKQNEPPEMHNFISKHLKDFEDKEVYLFTSSQHTPAEGIKYTLYQKFPSLSLQKVLAMHPEEHDQTKYRLVNFLNGL